MQRFVDENLENQDALSPANLRGGALALWHSTAHEAVCAGPAETGKTWGACRKLHRLMLEFPGAQSVMIRKTLSSLYTTVFQTFKRISGGANLKYYGGEKPEWVDYPNGSRIYFAGMDNPQKALSSERDFIYVNQAEELSANDWQVLTTRCTGRGGTTPWTQIFADCNPGAPSHWIRQREGLEFIESRHEDNPSLYDAEARTWTAQGQKTLAILNRLTGVLYQRLRLGKWVQAEGAVYEGFDAAVHCIDYTHPLIPGGKIPDDWRCLWVVDFGYSNPFVWTEWRVDKDERLFRTKEIYRSGRIVEDHAKEILRLTVDSPKPEVILCDHDAEDRATLEKHVGLPTHAARKAVSPGIQSVANRLRPAGDGWPRIFFLRDALEERDESLVALRKPFCTEQEFEVYVWPTAVDGKPMKEVPVDQHNHGMDCARYMSAHFESPEFFAQTAVTRSYEAGQEERRADAEQVIAGFDGDKPVLNLGAIGAGRQCRRW